MAILVDNNGKPVINNGKLIKGEGSVVSYTVELTDTRNDGYFKIYDGSNESGIYLADIGSGNPSRTVAITSGNLYLVADIGYFLEGLTVSGGITRISGGNKYDTAALFSVAANGTIVYKTHD